MIALTTYTWPDVAMGALVVLGGLGTLFIFMRYR